MALSGPASCNHAARQRHGDPHRRLRPYRPEHCQRCAGSGVSGSRRAAGAGSQAGRAPDRSQAFEGVFRRLRTPINTRVADHPRAWLRGVSPAVLEAFQGTGVTPRLGHRPRTRSADASTGPGPTRRSAPPAADRSHDPAATVHPDRTSRRPASQSARANYLIHHIVSMGRAPPDHRNNNAHPYPSVRSINANSGPHTLIASCANSASNGSQSPKASR